MSGLQGDRRTAPGKRAVTLIQAEHLPVIASLTSHETIDPVLLRRNIAVSGINLLSLKDKRFTLGGSVLQGTGICAPCSRMEDLLGPGGYNAMRGHGGITAKVVRPGRVAVSDEVTFVLRA
ncbi:MAG: MOSC domain-containing protein [Pseudomonadota bacterium]